MSFQKKPIRVLIVDDSALIRTILSKNLSKDSDIVVVGEAADPYAARDLIVELRPDVITLDIEMPRMDGITFLKHFMAVMPTPTIIVSSFTQKGNQLSLSALEAGAVDVIEKPSMSLIDDLFMSPNSINERIKRVAGLTLKKIDHAPPLYHQEHHTHLHHHEHQTVLSQNVSSHGISDPIIAIGSSTGGVEALNFILPVFSENSPGIVLVQHMPIGVTAAFSKRLDGLCKIHVKEAKNGDLVEAGLALIAPGGAQHMRVKRTGNKYRVILEEGEMVNFSRPSVDVLFNSLASEATYNVAAAILTGMGKDGAAGMLAIRKAGGRTYAQDEATSVVFGMPKMAIDLGGAEKILPLNQIPNALLNAFKR